MTDSVIDATASWLDEQTSDAGPPAATWALVEIFGHRKHYGRISEVEKFAVLGSRCHKS